MTPARDDMAVTRARRDVILRAVIFRHLSFAHGGCGSTVHQINQTLHEWIAKGIVQWPQASWPGAVSKPYHTGTYQHLQAMLGEGTVERVGGLWVPKVTAAGGFRARAEEVLGLKSEGKNGVQIAELLGISKSLVYSLISDPTGEKEKERKRGYCPSCGAKKRPEATACRNCSEKAQEKAGELLPPTTFTVYIERAREHGYELLFGVTTELQRVIRVGVSRGFFDHVVRHDLTWLDAVTELQDELGIPLL